MKLYKGLIPWGPKDPLDYLFAGQTRVYDSESRGNIPIVFKENTPWREQLTFTDFYRGRSAAGFIFESSLGTHYTMRMACLEHLLKTSGIYKGKTWDCLWAFTKQGANFSLMLVEE